MQVARHKEVAAEATAALTLYNNQLLMMSVFDFTLTQKSYK